ATGSGKSAIYQVTAVLRDGPTVVISPLLALQREQVERLDELDAGGALEANSAVGAPARRLALEELGRGDLEFLFLAPEQLANDDTIAPLRASAGREAPKPNARPCSSTPPACSRRASSTSPPVARPKK